MDPLSVISFQSCITPYIRPSRTTTNIQLRQVYFPGLLIVTNLLLFIKEQTPTMCHFSLQILQRCSHLQPGFIIWLSVARVSFFWSTSQTNYWAGPILAKPTSPSIHDQGNHLVPFFFYCLTQLKNISWSYLLVSVCPPQLTTRYYFDVTGSEK